MDHDKLLAMDTAQFFECVINEKLDKMERYEYVYSKTHGFEKIRYKIFVEGMTDEFQRFKMKQQTYAQLVIDVYNITVTPWEEMKRGGIIAFLETLEFDKLDSKDSSFPLIVEYDEPEKKNDRGVFTPRAKKAFQMAIDRGFMEKTSTGYKWTYNNGSRASLAYFVTEIYNHDGGGITPYQALGDLFGVKRLDSAADKAFNANNPQQWRSGIDLLIAEL